jgi:hypothetical protein
MKVKISEEGLGCGFISSCTYNGKIISHCCFLWRLGGHTIKINWFNQLDMWNIKSLQVVLKKFNTSLSE